MKLQLFYPIRPHVVNQKWGILNPIYQQFGFSRHNGEDINLINGQLIRAPLDCEVINIQNQPKGGGIFVGILSKNTYDFEDGKKAKVLIDFLHCKEILVSLGQQIPVGEALALGDSTGFSTGPHTHLQLRRVSWENKQLVFLDKNEANGSIDPSLYWTGFYAETWAWVRHIGLWITSFKKSKNIV